MAIKHTIRNNKGGLVDVELTPRKAIKRFCLECMCFVPQAVADCTSLNCPLYPFRLGDAHSMSAEQRKSISESNKLRQK